MSKFMKKWQKWVSAAGFALAVCAGFSTVTATTARASIIYDFSGTCDPTTNCSTPSGGLFSGTATTVAAFLELDLTTPGDWTAGDVLSYAVTLAGTTLTPSLFPDVATLGISPETATASNPFTSGSNIFQDSNDAASPGRISITMGQNAVLVGQVGLGCGFFGVCITAAEGQWTLRGGPSPQLSEPATLALFGLGLAGLGFMRRGRKLS